MARSVTTAKVRYVGRLTYSDLAPLLDELRLHFSSVDAKVVDTRRPENQGGGAFWIPFEIEVALLAAASVYVTAFLSEMAKDHYKAVRAKILELRERDRQTRQSSILPPFSVNSGKVRLMFEEPMSDAEFVEALTAASELLRTLPEDRLGSSEGLEWYMYTWTASSRVWTKQRPP